MSLLTLDDLEDHLGRSLTDDEVVRADALIGDTSANISGYTGQTFTEDTTTARLRLRQGFVILPQRPVTAVDSVEDVHGNSLSFTWDGVDRVYLASQVLDSFGWEPYLHPIRHVDVTYDHGYETVPADVVGVGCSVVLRALGRVPTDGAVVSESIDDYSYRIGTTGAAGAFGFLPDERATLDRYRRVGGSIALAHGL